MIHAVCRRKGVENTGTEGPKAAQIVYDPNPHMCTCHIAVF